jgi:hypothetical protein
LKGGEGATELLRERLLRKALNILAEEAMNFALLR